MSRAYRALCRQPLALANAALPVGAVVDVTKVNEHDGTATVQSPWDGHEGVVSLSEISRIEFYDALEKYPIVRRSSVKGARPIHEPVLGFILFEYIGSGPDELTVLPYDLVEVVRDIDQLWVWARLYVPGRTPTEGRVPRRSVAVQQVDQDECYRRQVVKVSALSDGPQ